MILKVYMTGLLLGLTMLAVSPNGCPPPKPPVVRLQQIDVPPMVFSVSGEVVAFRATGETGRTQKLKLPLDSFSARFGNFERALLFEFDSAGRRLSRHTLKLAADSSVSFRATTGNTYLIYFDFNKYLIPSYDLTCQLGRMGLGGSLVPEICTQIYCTSQPFRASELPARVPGAVGQRRIEDLGGSTVGGFGASGDICSRCFEKTFYPSDRCSLNLPVGVAEEPATRVIGEEVVFQHAPYDPARRQLGRSQIYKMQMDGSHSVNLSNSQFNDTEPDVSPDGRRIVFVRDGSLYVMDIDGRNVTAIPDTSEATSAKWSRGADPFIIYVHHARLPGNLDLGEQRQYVINSIRPDGTEHRRIAPRNSGTASSAEFPVLPSVHYLSPNVFPDGDHIVFTMREETKLPGGLRRARQNLYVMSISRYRSSGLLFTDGFASPAVISHSGDLMAFFVPAGGAGETAHGNQIHVARLKMTGEDRWSLNPLHDLINLDASFKNVTGLNFSNGDARLYFSAEIEGGSSEIFSVKLDGTDLRRLTNNAHLDTSPSVVPR